VIKPSDFNSDVITEPCISFERTTVYPQVRINFFYYFWYQTVCLAQHG